MRIEVPAIEVNHLVFVSASGTNRTNRGRLTMHLTGVDRKLPSEGQNDTVDPEPSSAG